MDLLGTPHFGQLTAAPAYGSSNFFQRPRSWFYVESFFDLEKDRTLQNSVGGAYCMLHPLLKAWRDPTVTNLGDEIEWICELLFIDHGLKCDFAYDLFIHSIKSRWSCQEVGVGHKVTLGLEQHIWRCKRKHVQTSNLEWGWGTSDRLELGGLSNRGSRINNPTRNSADRTTFWILFFGTCVYRMYGV